MDFQALEQKLKKRAAKKGIKPGTKAYVSYVFGTMARESKRQLLVNQAASESNRQKRESEAERR